MRSILAPETLQFTVEWPTIPITLDILLGVRELNKSIVDLILCTDPSSHRVCRTLRVSSLCDMMVLNVALHCNKFSGAGTDKSVFNVKYLA